MYIVFKISDIIKAILFTIVLIIIKFKYMDIPWLVALCPAIIVGTIVIMCYLYCVIYNYIHSDIIEQENK